MAGATGAWPAAPREGLHTALREAFHAALRIAPWAALCASLHAGLAPDARAVAPGAAAIPAVALQGNAEAGRIKAEAERCLECHGQPGVGQGHSAGEDGKFARLGGQQHAYIVKQVRDFRAGRRKNDFMAMMANSIGDEDGKAMREEQPVKAAQAGGKGGATHGYGSAPGAAAQLYLHGDAARKVASCAACHGAGGEGIAGVGPVIGGQGRRYLSQQLHNWRSGERNNGPAPGMREATAGLTDAEIEALALYVSGM